MLRWCSREDSQVAVGDRCHAFPGDDDQLHRSLGALHRFHRSPPRILHERAGLRARGDGVPDCKDKQLITPTECQPVNADGVGKCPDPECCKNIVAATPTVAPCPSDYPSLTFKGNVPTLSNDAKAMLATVASKMKASPTCNISITGYPEASKAAQAVCNKRNEAIKMYLVEKEGAAPQQRQQQQQSPVARAHHRPPDAISTESQAKRLLFSAIKSAG